MNLPDIQYTGGTILVELLESLRLSHRLVKASNSIKMLITFRTFPPIINL